MELECERDRGKQPTVLCLRKETCQNKDFRATVWTGEHLQLTVMSIPVGGEIGLERHDELDQLLYIESGFAKIYLGKTKESLSCLGTGASGNAVLIPACTWHNLVNAQNIPVKLFSVYAPPQHPFCTVHKTKQEADLAES
ncbi:MAG: cupin domain-containing protein [Clostridia bacterium]|nr:cupin domain-containing protein [Clostridia bacterium]